MISSLLMGARVVLYTGRRFDGHEVWELVERERVTKLGLVGDAMARPLADALARGRADGSRYDTSTLVQIGSGGAILSASVQQQLRDLLPDIELADVMGSSESGLFAFQTLDASDMAPGAQPRFALDAIATVLGDDQRPVVAGSGVIGRLACRGHVPIGYLKDAERTAATFPVIDGERWVVPGDFATLEADGSIRLLGRGSVCINTGGEKVFPEEVEAAVKAHPAVFDAVIVGVPDDRFGERIAAVVQPRSGATVTIADLDAHCRARLAAYKVPRELHLVDEVVRHSSGKPDYRWAADIARPAQAAGITS